MTQKEQEDLYNLLKQWMQKFNEFDGYGRLFRALGGFDRLFTKLNTREHTILIYRFGLNGDGTHTLEECGKEFSVTKERIRQIEAKALEKIRI